MATVNKSGFGYSQSLTVSASTKTVDDTDCGLVQNITATCTITLPATVVGYAYTFRVGAAGITVNISPNASDKIAGNGFTATDNKDAIATTQPVGSILSLVGDGVNGYMVSEVRGTWTREA